MNLLQGTKQRRERRSYAIRGYTGSNGHGKTTAAVFDLLPTLDAGRPVLSTCRILDFRNPRPCDHELCAWPGHPDHAAAHPLWIPFDDWRQLLDFERGEILMDEVAGVASSRESGSLPFQVARELQKLRKRDVMLSYTAPSFARCEKIIREVTTLLTDCRGHMAKRVEGPDGLELMWRTRSVFGWRSYDGREYEQFTTGARERGPKPLVRQLFRITGSEVSRAFDTTDAVLSLGWANDAGMCIECGGQRAKPRCTCGVPHAVHATAPEAEEAAAGRKGARARGPATPHRPGLVLAPLSGPQGSESGR